MWGSASLQQTSSFLTLFDFLLDDSSDYTNGMLDPLHAFTCSTRLAVFKSHDLYTHVLDHLKGQYFGSLIMNQSRCSLPVSLSSAEPFISTGQLVSLTLWTLGANSTGEVSPLTSTLLIWNNGVLCFWARRHKTHVSPDLNLATSDFLP